MYQLRTLGTLDLRATDGHPIHSLLSQPKRSALLCYLAVAIPHGFHRRERIASVFWPDSAVERARHSLRQALHAIRTSLGEASIETRGDDEVALSTAHVWCDAAELDRAFAEQRWSDAVELHRGPLLDGFYVDDSPEFEHWLDEQRERLRMRAEAAAWKCVEGAQDRGSALSWGRRALELAELDEVALRRFMQLAASLEDRSAALQAHEKFVTRMRREYELEPSAETEALARELRQATTSPSVTDVSPPRPPAPALVPVPLPVARRARRGVYGALALGVLLVVGALVARGPLAPWSGLAAAAGASVAVVPFSNLSGDPSQRFFSDGFTEQLSNELVAVAGLRVLAPSAFAFAGEAAQVRELARQFAYAQLLEGSVRRSGDNIRITARLVRTVDNQLVWSRTYDRQLTPAGVLAVQEEIARAIAGEFKAKLPPDAAEPMRPAQPRNQQASDAYWRGLGALAQVSRAGNEVAVREFERAIALDPQFAPAHEGLAMALAGYWKPRRDDPRGAEKLQRGREAAVRALQLDSTRADARVVLSNLTRDAAERNALLAAALRHQPASRWARFYSAFQAFDAMDRTRAIAIIDTLLALDPASPWNHIMAANLFNHVGQYARADSALQRAEQLSTLGFGPRPLWPFHWNCAYLAIVRGDYESASRHLRKGYAQEVTVNAQRSAEVLAAIAAIQKSPLEGEVRRQRSLALVASNEAAIQRQFAAMLYLNFGDRHAFYRLFERSPLEIGTAAAVFDAVRDEPRFRQLAAVAQRLRASR